MTVSSEHLLEEISILLGRGDEVEVGKAQALIAAHWGTLPDQQLPQVAEIRTELSVEVNSSEPDELLAERKDRSVAAQTEQLALFDGANEWSGGDRATFEREQAAWLAIAEGLGSLGYELDSAEETRDWVVRNLL